MCGFAGYIHNYGTFDKEEVIHKMADRIKHRGPDDAHYYIDDGIALGFSAAFPSSTLRAADSRS